MTPFYSDIPELADTQPGGGLIRIPVEQDVPFTPRVRALVDTPEFQRLRQISQLGLVSRVYPAATHTRFEHALGVFQNAIRYLRQLGRDRRFCQTVDSHTVEVLLAASLLHDLGHWPFCHPIEDMALPELEPHEAFAEKYLTGGSGLARVLRSEWKVDPAEVLDVLVGTGGSPALRMVRSILSGPIDVDKMDYLDRDSLHAGVPYGRNFDRSRLIQSLLVNAAGDGLAISSKGKTAAELMVFARYVMFSEVYWHHAVRSATSMFARAFYNLRDRLELNSLFLKTEVEVIDQMRLSAAGTDSAALIDGIFGATRRLYKRVGEYSLYQHREVYEKLARQPFPVLVRCAQLLSQELSTALGVPIHACQLLIDAPPPHREIEFDVEIYFPKEDVYRPLHEVSPVVEALARTQFDDYVKRVRLFADPQFAGRIAGSDRFAACLSAAIDRMPGPA